MEASEATLKRILAALAYNPETGAIRRKRASGSVARKLAGTNSNGYVSIAVNGKRYYGHRLAWLFVNGAWPTGNIDHINGDRGDNRIVNLRDCSAEINAQNQRRAKNGTRSGLLGASFSQGKWQAVIGVGGKNRYIGRFDTPEEAHEAYKNAKRNVHAGCTI